MCVSEILNSAITQCGRGAAASLGACARDQRPGFGAGSFLAVTGTGSAIGIDAVRLSSGAGRAGAAVGLGARREPPGIIRPTAG